MSETSLRQNEPVRNPSTVADGDSVLRVIEKARTIRAAFEAVPHALFIVDADIRIQDCNERALELVGATRESAISFRGGEVLNCLRHLSAPHGCGTHSECCQCVIRNSVASALRGSRVHRQFTRMQLRRDQSTNNADFLVSTSSVSPTECLLMLENVTELLALRELVPICASCRAIRINATTWQPLERYLHDELQVKLTHGLCPVCLKRDFPGLSE